MRTAVAVCSIGSSLLAAGCGGDSGGGGTPPPATGASTGLSAKLSMAGTWAPVDGGAAAVIGPFWNAARMGSGRLEGLVMDGWAYTGFNNSATAVTPVRAVAFQQQSDGRLLEATSSLFGDALTNGAGSAIVADFNGDGLDDVVLPAHNESPFIAAPSTAFVSRSDGGFARLTLPDSVMDHDARLVTIGGRQMILARSFGGSGNGGNGPGFNVLYSWNGAGFDVDLSLGDLGGMAVLGGRFGDDGSDWLIVGDSTYGPGVPWTPANPMLNYAYRYSGGRVVLPPVQLPAPYFNDKPEYSGFTSQWDPYSKTHTSRLWTTDLNQDGRLDILAGQELWSASAGLQRSVFQLLLNEGGMRFADATDTLAPEYAKTSYSMDYSVRLADVDGSGIDTLFLSGGALPTPSLSTVHGNYMLVNDGTGRLYAALHDEFASMASSIIAYAQSQVPAGRTVKASSVPAFYPYRTGNGLINYLAMMSLSSDARGPFVFVNVALGTSPVTDFRRDLSVTTRNGSRNIRTFAGNDTIQRAASDPDCRIDGGSGVNTVVYPGKRADWIVARAGTRITVAPASGSGGTDSLTHIQKARFDDITLDLTTLP
jgi:hypothetical protein